MTPTTKGEAGAHDVPITCADVVEQGLVEASLWQRIHDVALALFARGVAVGEQAGLILADTKYEFGLTDDGELLLIDEMHTPDSSRWWVADSYGERMTRGEEPESLDKEVVRRALRAAGYDGDGPPPELPAEVWVGTTARYVDAYERITGMSFDPAPYPADVRIAEAVKALGAP